jgi:hypothetical protein
MGGNGMKRASKITYAIPAVCSVERNPHNIAEVAMRAITRRRDGANADRTPIWIPNAARFANPHKAYVAMVCARGDSG